MVNQPFDEIVFAFRGTAFRLCVFPPVPAAPKRPNRSQI
jgi:hypothetical protein